MSPGNDGPNNNLEDLGDMPATNLAPLVNGDSGRDESGRFAPGNAIAKGGDPYARRCAELRAALINAISVEDIRQIAAKMVEAAKGGDWNAAKIALDRALGRAVTPVMVKDVTDDDPLPPLPEGPVQIYIPDNRRDAPPPPMETLGEELMRAYSEPAYLEWRRAQGLPAGDTIPPETIGVAIQSPGHVITAASAEYRRFCEERKFTRTNYRGVEIVQREDFFQNQAHERQRQQKLQAGTELNDEDN